MNGKTPILSSCLLLTAALVLPLRAETVTLLKVPQQGVQPQTLVDSKGQLHLVFLAGPAGKSDVFHCRLDATTKTFSQPQRVNQTPGSAMATGTIRGAQAAWGREDRLHILWNGTVPDAQGKPQMDVLYTSSGPATGAFAAERALMHEGKFLDGGATITADAKGNVYALWHAQPKSTPPGAGESARTIYLSVSHDDGKHFAPETSCSASAGGICGCCSLRAGALPTGVIYTLFRNADGTNRSMQMLRSQDAGVTFQRTELDAWPVNACPMSSSFLQPTPKGLLGAWETGGKIYLKDLTDPKAKQLLIASEGCKHPSLTQNERGETLVAWAKGTGWQRGGTLSWVILDAAQKVIEQAPAAATPENSQVPVWSYPAAAHVPSLGFVLVH